MYITGYWLHGGYYGLGHMNEHAHFYVLILLVHRVYVSLPEPPN